MCLYPQTIRNPRYKGKIAPKGLGSVTIKCGVCIECRQARAREWQQRIEQEVRNPNNSSFVHRFVTFTVSDETAADFGIDYTTSSTIETEEAAAELYQKENEMMKTLVSRWRRKCQKRGIKQKHFFITEHGKTRTERIHIHGIIWFEPQQQEELEKNWPWGFMDIGDFRDSTVPYIVKYIHKIQEGHPTYKAIVLTTPGIGKCYVEKARSNGINKWKEEDTDMSYRRKDGTRVALCDYYKRKLFSQEELERYRTFLNKTGRRWVRRIEYDLRQPSQREAYGKKLVQEQEKQPSFLRPSFAKSKKNTILRPETSKKQTINESTRTRHGPLPKNANT